MSENETRQIDNQPGGKKEDNEIKPKFEPESGAVEGIVFCFLSRSIDERLGIIHGHTLHKRLKSGTPGLYQKTFPEDAIIENWNMLMNKAIPSAIAVIEVTATRAPGALTAEQGNIPVTNVTSKTGRTFLSFPRHPFLLGFGRKGDA